MPRLNRIRLAFLALITITLTPLTGEGHQADSSARSGVFPDLVDVTSISGLPVSGPTSGAILLDLDLDGLPDLLLGHHSSTLLAYKNLGGLRFARMADWGPHIEVTDHHASLVGDFDRDGIPDLYLIVGAQRGEGAGNNALFLSTGGYKTDEAAAWGIQDTFGRGRGAILLDILGNSAAELLVLNYKTAMRQFSLDPLLPGLDEIQSSFNLPPAQDEQVTQYYQAGESSAEFRYRSEYVHSLFPQDLDADGDLDFLAFGGPPVQILRNSDGRLRFDVPLLPQSVYIPSPVSGVWGDFDADGSPDIYLVYGATDFRPLLGGARHDRLLLWRTDQFSDETGSRLVQSDRLMVRGTTSGMDCGMDCAAADFDNNGSLDLVVLKSDRGTGETWHQILLNFGAGDFTQPGHSRVSERRPGISDGVLVADLDRDGDIDILEILGAIGNDAPGGGVCLYRNVQDSGNWLSIHLESHLGSSPYGARVEIAIGARILYRQYWPGQVKGSSFPTDIHFGLGQAVNIDRLTVYWPAGELTTLHDVRINQRLSLFCP
ncbi:MAG: CRTAC1 family protein [bacterium]